MAKVNILISSIFCLSMLTNNATSNSLIKLDLEKCKIIDKNGNNLIKEKKSDCATSKHGCSGRNQHNDPEAWIYVPSGKCEQINNGIIDGLDQNTLDKIDLQKLKNIK